MKLKGKSAIVTGASRGLGRAVARELAKEGARVMLMSRSQKELRKVAKEIEDDGGVSAFYTGDVSRQEDVLDMVGETKRLFSRIDVLVNNAAVIGPVKFLGDTDVQRWKMTLDTNLNGVFLCSWFVAPVMYETGGGKIINISSGLGQMPFPRFCAYATSKAGVIQFTRSLSEELKEGKILVNAIDPGVMDTPMQEEIRGIDPSLLGASLQRHFLEYKEKGQLKDPGQVARLIVFLSSSESNHITGHYGGLQDYIRLGWNGDG
jgi:NAD(P)-dependent dehydrogenase (short-subunit alcohol dehydrogenase family)